MKALILSVVVCAALALCMGDVAVATMSHQAYCDDAVVYDETNLVFFYPDMNNDGLLYKTKAEQQLYIDQLNAEAFANITDWRFATFDELFSMMWSFTEHCSNPPDPTANPPYPSGGYPPGLTPMDFFPSQNTWVGDDGVTNCTPCGRPADEVGIRIEVPMAVPSFPEIYPRDFNYLFIDGFEEFPQIPRPFAADDPESDSPLQFLTGLPMDGEYHFAWKQEGHPTQGWQLMFDDDHNWGLDNEPVVDAVYGSIYKADIMGGFMYGPLDHWVCSAWIASNTGPLEIDVCPGQDVNYVSNDGCGVIKVVIMGGSDCYDIYDIDPETLRFEGLPVHLCSCHGEPEIQYIYVNCDGYRDMYVKFTDIAGAIPEGTTVGKLTCNLYDGTTFQGGDAIELLPGKHEVLLKARGRVVVGPNYPNPFNPKTSIFFAVHDESPVKVDVFDVSGRRVTTLADDVFGEGEHSVEWDASGLSSGVYFYRVETPEFTETRRMVLLK